MLFLTKINDIVSRQKLIKYRVLQKCTQNLLTLLLPIILIRRLKKLGQTMTLFHGVNFLTVKYLWQVFLCILQEIKATYSYVFMGLGTQHCHLLH